MPSNSFAIAHTDVQRHLLSLLDRKARHRGAGDIYLLLVEATFNPIMLDKLVKAANEIKGVVPLRELDANVRLLPRLLVIKQDREEAARVHAALDDIVVIVRGEGALRKIGTIFVHECDLAARRTDHCDLAEAAPHLLTSPVLSSVPRRTRNGRYLEHVARPLVHQCHLDLF